MYSHLHSGLLTSQVCPATNMTNVLSYQDNKLVIVNVKLERLAKDDAMHCTVKKREKI